MKPYYEESGITIYHCDCRDVLPQLKADVLVTDPPYGLGKLNGTTSVERNRNNYGGEFEDTAEYVQAVVVPSIETGLAACGGRGLITTGIRCMFLYPNPRTVGGFYHPAAMGRNPWGFNSFTPILFYGKDPRDGKGQDATMITVTERASNDQHPCAKPFAAMKWMVGKASLEGEVVLEPFMGSGTTLLAAKDLGRKAIGVEIEERYCEIAAERLRQGVFSFDSL